MNEHDGTSGSRCIDPYVEAATALDIRPMAQARLVYDSLEHLTHGVACEQEETRLHAIIHLGLQIIPVRDYLLGMVSFTHADVARPLIEALDACAQSAPIEYQPQVAAACAMLACGVDADHHTVQRLIGMAEGTSLARLVQNGVDMRAPASLYRLSMQHCMPSVIAQLETE